MSCATKPIPTAVVVDLAEPTRARLRRLAACVTAQVRQVLLAGATGGAEIRARNEWTSHRPATAALHRPARGQACLRD